jgi:hypothetical protein
MSSNCRWRRLPPNMESIYECHISTHRQWRSGSTPMCGFGRGPTSHYHKTECGKTLCRAYDLDGFFGMTDAMDDICIDGRINLCLDSIKGREILQ